MYKVIIISDHLGPCPLICNGSNLKAQGHFKNKGLGMGLRI